MVKKLVTALILLFCLFTASFAALRQPHSSIQELSLAYNDGRLSSTIKSCKQLIKNGDILGYLNLAAIFKDLGHYEKAIRVLGSANKIFSDDIRILTLLGRLYYLNHQIEEAIAVFEKIIKLDSDDINANTNLGLCYGEKGNDVKAQEYFEKAALLNKSSLIARLSLADLYRQKGKLREAINEYKTVNLIDASILRVQKVLGDLFYRIGSFQESLKIYGKIQLIEPDNPMVKQRIAEINDKLGKEYFEKEREKIALHRKQKVLLVKPYISSKKTVAVRVGIVRNIELIEFKCSRHFEIKTASGKVYLANGLENKNYSVVKKADDALSVSSLGKEDILINEPFYIASLEADATITLFNVSFGKGNFWSGKQDRSYRGLIEIANDTMGMKVINTLSLEEYLYSVVPSEMPAHWAVEALKAQATAARAEAMAKLGRHKDAGFDFCAEVHCQSYNGVGQETRQTNIAVDGTEGIIMAYKGKPVDALYSSNCGGHTQGNIFGEGKDIPYLRGKIDADEKHYLAFPLSPIDLEYWLKQPLSGLYCDFANSAFRWERIYTAEELKEILGKIADIGEIRKIIVLSRKASGHVNRIKLIGSNNSYILEKELVIRNSLGNLRSSMFKVEIKYDARKKPEQFIFYGGGWGHGVGMCQTGAKGMAESGNDYKQILSHYFQGIEFQKIY